MTLPLNEEARKTPDLSVVITVVSGAEHLSRCLAALLKQGDGQPEGMEVIVPFDRHDTAIPQLKSEFPEVRFYPVTLSIDAPAGLCHEHFDELRATGLHLARGKLVAILEDHEIPASDWYKNIMKSHASPHAAVGGAVENGIDRPINWATYFFDFGRYQNPVPAGPSQFLTDVNVAYKRTALGAIKHVWQHGFHEPAVHDALLSQGETLWLSPEIVVHQYRSGLRLAHAIRERLIWGRYFSGNRVAGANPARRLAYCALSPLVPFIILAKMFFNVLTKNRLGGKFLQALPYTLLLAVAWSWGEFIGYATGRPSAFSPAKEG